MTNILENLNNEESVKTMFKEFGLSAEVTKLVNSDPLVNNEQAKNFLDLFISRYLSIKMSAQNVKAQSFFSKINPSSLTSAKHTIVDLCLAIYQSPQIIEEKLIHAQVDAEVITKCLEKVSQPQDDETLSSLLCLETSSLLACCSDSRVHNHDHCRQGANITVVTTPSSQVHYHRV